MKVVKNQSWYEIEHKGKYINSYPISSRKNARVAIAIAKRHGKDIDTAIILAKDIVNFFA